MSLKLRIKREDIIAFFLIFPFIPVNALNAVTGDMLYDVLALADIAYILLLCIRNRYKFNAMEICLGIYAVILCASCVLNGKSIIPGIYYGGKLFAFVIINNFYLKNESTTLLRVSYKYMTILILINTFFQFVAQDAFGYQAVSGNYNNFFAGDNLIGYYYVAYFVLGIILDRIDIGKMSNLMKFMIIISAASLIRAWSAKSIVGLVMILFYLLLIYRKKIAKLLNFEVLTAVYVVVFVGIVFFSIQENFAGILETYLQKDATLTGRTYIWESAIVLIRNSFIYGYGTVNGGMLQISTSYGGNSVGSHNYILEVLLQTGILGLIAILGFFYFSLKKRTKKWTDEKRYDYLMILFMTFVILVMYISSMTIYTIFAYLPVVLCYNIERFTFVKDEKVTK